MTTDTSFLKRFQSLGDNCEFGFVQRKCGLEPGNLLRWAISPIDPLIKALSNKFDGVFQLEKLTPISKTMVRDSHTGLSFHTKMPIMEANGVIAFDGEEADIRSVYEDERKKIAYLTDKLLNDLSDGGYVYTYRTRHHLDDAKIVAIGDVLAKYNSGNQFVFVASKQYFEDNSYSIRELSSNSLICFVDRYSPPDKADDVSYDSWISALRNVDKHLSLNRAA